MGTAHPSHPTPSAPKGIPRYPTPLSRVLPVDYQLSSGPPSEPENSFPAGLIDVIAVHKYLIRKAGFLPQDITVGGGSAAGNLALTLTGHVVESYLPHLPTPEGLIALSPSSDMSFSRSASIRVGSSHLLTLVPYPAGTNRSERIRWSSVLLGLTSVEWYNQAEGKVPLCRSPTDFDRSCTENLFSDGPHVLYSIYD